MNYPVGAASVSIDVRVVDDAGLPAAGLLAASFPPLFYSLAGAHADATFSLSDLAAVTSPWAAGGVKERGGGVYRLDLPDAVFTAAGKVTLRAEASGKRLIFPAIEVGTILAPGAVPSPPPGDDWLRTALSEDWAVFDTPRTVTLRARSEISGGTPALTTITHVQREATTVDDLAFAPALLNKRSAAFNVWRSRLGASAAPREDDVLDDGSVRWKAILIQVLDEEQRYRVICIRER